MQNKPEQDRNQEATVYLGNLDERCTDALIWELMLQAGPVSNVFLPKDRISMSHQGFGFCEFLSEDDAEYAVKIMNQIKLYGKPIRVNKASYDNRKEVDIGANLFIGSLDEQADETALYDVFSTFGAIAEHPKIARDPTTGQSKGYGFVSYHDFEAADMAIENMNGQFFGGKQISVQYAFKKDGKGERHGTQAERLLAAQAKKHAIGPGTSYSYGGQFAGALAAQPSAPVQPAYQSVASQPPPPPPPGMPVYQPQQGYPGQDYGQSYPAPPAGFPVANGYSGYQQPSQQGGAAPPPPPPIRMGF
ncbi:hypothetical protein BD324DRAFT_631089 [Kockovaella imperatae]|uniref:RRM domain-containing protein n=1 Tax=Kockovaella imperatae TaxID=4999 RepID=A0A1Y1UC92_9TREE|nr:hypothetical protein BD324DRAFT_631089 [Kockovaella imperatae]ORX35668.1 hypothetical protein BD324DRAFT_631089 [Kockovaella imperatae]